MNLLLVFAVFFFWLPRPVRSSFGRRGSSQSSPSSSWGRRGSSSSSSSSGLQGLDHSGGRADDTDLEAVVPVKAVSSKRRVVSGQEEAVPSPSPASDGDPWGLEHHPYASGVFTLDPTFGMF